MSRHVTMATWDDAPHLTAEAKKELWSSIPPHQREARSKGIPVLGSGAVYPVDEATIRIKDRAIPDDWPRVYGMDVGWNWTANAWLARNPASKELFLYACRKAGHAEPAIHATAIKALGDWVPGVIDPAANASGQRDGRQLLAEYTSPAIGLHLRPAVNAVEAGIMKVWQLLSTGQLKVFESCHDWWDEFRNYHRDQHGRIVKMNDHLMDATRYAVVSGLVYMDVEPRNEDEQPRELIVHEGNFSQGWMT